MRFLLDHPVLLLVVSLAFFTSATRLGAALQLWHRPLDETTRGDFDIVLGATLTLLSLLVGFSFSMASSRYDLRKECEEREANAIGTAYNKADLLPGADAQKVHQLLREYTGLRIRFYTADGRDHGQALGLATRQMQARLWGTVATAVHGAPTAVSAMAAGAMTDAIDSEGYAQAAAWNRIPMGAWVLLYVLGGVAMTMIGYRFRIGAAHYLLMLISPGVVAVALFLIADIDCPHNGVIRVAPENLLALIPSLA
jgi:hypothetical protein